MMRTLLLWWALAAAGGAAVAATDLPYAFLNVPYWLLFAGACITLVPGGVVLAGARTSLVHGFHARWLLPCVLLAVLAVQIIAVAWWPNSGDEYGYAFLARTLLHGRFYNPPPPMPELFRFNWIFVRDGKWFSQYPPGFPALLAPFLAVGLPFILNPILTVLLAWLVNATLRAVGAGREAASALACLIALSPFVLFNGASLYPHTLTAVAVTSIIQLQFGAEERPSIWPRLGMGAMFGVLLLTRYEVFAIVAALFIVDRCYKCRLAAIAEFLPMGLGGLPFALFFLVYNNAITGHMLLTPFSWASPGGGFGFHAMSDDGMNTPFVALRRTAEWTWELMAYSSAALVLLWAAAFATKLRHRRIRYFDLIFPAAIAFFFLFAHAGGHRFGPRYWFFAWPPTIVTIATALLTGDGWLRLKHWRLHVPTLAALHLPLYATFALGVALYHGAYVSLRREVYAARPPQLPAIVLIPTRLLPLTRWQTRPTAAGSADFARNGVDIDAPLIYGRADNATRDQGHFVAMACSLRDRHVYVWRAPGALDAVDCNRK